MKKTAIVSCYFQNNYGSMLQAYATQMALDKLGISNETINISGFADEINKAKIKYFAKASFTSDILLSKAGMARNVVKKRISRSDYSKKCKQRSAKFDSFERTFFRLSSPFNSLEALGEQCADLYSTVVVGSDQLWLPANIAANYYTLSFVPNTVNTVAYATSFGQASLPRDSARKAKVFLKNIRHISVREESGQKLVKELTGRDVPIVSDPTLLFTGEEWMDIQQIDPVIEGNYIFCYFLGKNPAHRKFAEELKRKTGYKIVALTHLDEYVKNDNDYADEAPYSIGPAEFINLIRNAKYVCTDSFHCSAFSILYEKSFFAFRRYTRKTRSSTNSRLDSLFSSMGIHNPILNGDENIDECMEETIDYNSVQKKAVKIREESYNYLINALKG